jgi:oxalate---CoA ligase
MRSASPEGAVDYLGLQHWATATPLATALVAPGQEPLTYSGLWDHITAMSAALNKGGLHPNEVAVLALANGPAFVTASLAITCQCACAPFDLDLSKDECEFFLARLNASALVYEEGIYSPIVVAARNLGLRMIRIRISEDGPTGVFSLDFSEGRREEKPGRQTDAAFLFHTSATTDAPKLVPRSRTNTRAAAEQDAQALQLSAADRFLSLMPLSYAHGIGAVFSQLVCGGTVLCAPALQAHNFVATLEKFRPTWFSASPAIQRIVLKLLQDSPEIVQRIPLRFVRSAGAAPTPDVILMQEKLFGAPVLDGYGMTEAPSVARNTLSQRKPRSVGKSTGTNISIMGDFGELLPPETEGEVVLRGPTVMSGYLDNPEANQVAFHDGWFRTGDIGRLDSEGYLFIVGRRKEMINRGGKKIFPQEVDVVLTAHPAVVEAASFAVPHRSLGEDIAAAVVLRPGIEVSELELRRFTAERLAGHKVPRKVVFTGKIPRTATGKPKRGELAAEFRERAAPPVATSKRAFEAAQLSSIEKQVADIWRRVLGVERVEITDDFFDLGGDSLSTALMLTEVEKSARPSGSRLDLSIFFVEPTVASLARILADSYNQLGRERSTADRILFLRKEGNRSPFFCFSDSETNQHQFHYLFRWLGPERPFVVVCPTPTVQAGRRLGIDEIARQSVASIRAIHPDGPYILGGYCFGGVVAFETARQLLEQGSEVSLLALFDSPTPGYPKVMREWKRYVDQSMGILRALAKGKCQISTRDIAAHFRALANIVSRKFGTPARRGLSAAGLREVEPGESANSMSRREYVPPVLSVPIVHFLGADVPVSTKVLSDPRLGWRDFAGAGFQARLVPGDHVSIFSLINAPALATELDSALVAADSAFHRGQPKPQTCIPALESAQCHQANGPF